MLKVGDTKEATIDFLGVVFDFLFLIIVLNKKVWNRIQKDKYFFLYEGNDVTWRSKIKKLHNNDLKRRDLWRKTSKVNNGSEKKSEFISEARPFEHITCADDFTKGYMKHIATPKRSQKKGQPPVENYVLIWKKKK